MGGGYLNPKCGYNFESGVVGLKVTSPCFSGGNTMLVFFSILVGGFGLGQVGPGIQAITAARISAAKMLKVINRVPKIDPNDKGGNPLVLVLFGKNIENFQLEPVDPQNPYENPNPVKPIRPTNRQQLDVAEKYNPQVKGEIKFTDVHFNYKKMDAENNTEEKKLFSGIDLTITPGETVALVGESGSGKSTIGKLAQRFYNPSSGAIELDGIDLKKIDLKVRTNNAKNSRSEATSPRRQC